MSSSPCSSVNIADDILYGDDNNKFVHTNNATSTFLNHQQQNNSVEITSSLQSQTLKHFLAQKYAAESTSDNDAESHSNTRNNNNRTTINQMSNNNNNNNSNQQSSFTTTISNFYPFSPLVSSSSNSHFDTRNILPDGVLESSIDSLQVESSTNEQQHQQASGHSAAVTAGTVAHSLFAQQDLTPMDNFIKQEDIVGIKLTPTSAPTNVTSSSTNNGLVRPNTQVSDGDANDNLCRVEIVPSNLFDTVNSDITVDSTTTINISQPTTIINSTLPQLSFNNFPSPLIQTTSSSSSLLPSNVLTYGLSPSFSSTLLQIDSNHQQMIPSLASPTIPIDHYFNQPPNSGIVVENKKPDEHQHVILDQHQLLPSSIQPFSNDNNHFLISDNSLTENLNLFQDIHNDDHFHTEMEIANVHENVISDLPVLTRARASLPIDYLYLQETENGLGVFARKLIPKRTQFGPIEGVIVSLPENQLSSNNIAYGSKFNLIIFISENFLLSQADENSSNWTRFVRPANNLSEQNLELITKEFTPLNEVKFYFYTTRNILPNEELKVWYSDEYAQTFNIKPLDGSPEIGLLNPTNENNNNNCIVENNNDHQKKDDFQQESNTTSNSTGHKLRNKMAKTQMIQQANPPINHNNNNDIHNGDKLMDSFDHNHVTLNGSQIQHLFGNSDLSVPETMLNGNLIVEKEKTMPESNENDQKSNDSKTANTKEKRKYRCDKCQKTFPRPYSLTRHLVMHTGEKRHRCWTCGMAFNHVYNRNRHAKTHKNHLNNEAANNTQVEERVVANDENGKQNGSNLIDSSEQAKNVENGEKSIDSIDSSSNQTKQSDSTKMSDMVSSSGLDKSNNKINSTNQTNMEKIHRCSQCYKRFSSKERLDKHSIVHDESAKKLSCGMCGKKFLTNSALSCHMKYHQYSEDKPRQYDCALCDKVFENIQSRREHVSVHVNQDTGLFHCPQCPKTFENFSVIRKHLKSNHSNEIFPCDQCPKEFPRQDKLRLHMLCHIDRWEFKCNFCEKQFKRKDKLKEHTVRMHDPNRSDRIAAKNAARLQRIKVQRTKKVATKPSQPNYHEYVYKCHLCLFGFKRRGMLVNHLAKRHPEIPYKSVPELNMPIVKTSKDYYCQYCAKVYKSSSKRKAHIIKNHPGKSLPPSNRNKAIPTTDTVNQTFSATVGRITIDPHFCDWCHKQYASKAKLMQHQRKKHPEKMPSSSMTKTNTDNNNNNNDDNVSIVQQPLVGTTNTYKLNTIIEGDKATFTTIPILADGTIKSELNDEHQMITVDTSKMDQFLSDPSPTPYLDGFTISNHHHYTNSKDGANGFLNGTPMQLPQQQVHYTIDNSNPSFEDLMNINIGTDVNHNLNSMNNSNSPFANNVITILACTNPNTGATTFTSGDLSEFSDIITQISDFQLADGKSAILSTNSASAVLHNASPPGNTDLMISGTIEENNWNQVCEEMAIV